MVIDGYPVRIASFATFYLLQDYYLLYMYECVNKFQLVFEPRLMTRKGIY